jgi:hypothetical protein
MGLPNENIIAQHILRLAAFEKDVEKIATSIADDELRLFRISRRVVSGDEFTLLQHFDRRFDKAKNSLIKKGLIVQPRPGQIIITYHGRAVLAAWEATM